MDSQITSETAEEVACLMVLGIGLQMHKKTVKRKYWERPHLGIKKRLVHGQHNLLNEMRLSDVNSFSSIIRFSPESFYKLLGIVGPSITHFSNREPIQPSTRLAVTLRHLATGETKKSLSYNYRLGISTTDAIVKETLAAIYNTLKLSVLPDLTTAKWLEVAEKYQQRWNVPNCCGSVDGKHIRIKKPKKSGSEYFNYKGFHSVTMMAICDSEYKFLAVDVGCQGRNNDAIVLNDSNIGKKLMNGTFNFPGEKAIKYGPQLPHYLLGDEIFGLQPYLMVPYPGRGTGMLSYTQKIFNYRQSRGRRVIENTFGIFASVWRIFYTEINAPPEEVDKIVMAAVCLHNFRIMEREDVKSFIPAHYNPNSDDQTQLYSIRATPNAPTASNLGHYVRDELAQYFINGGSVYWQDRMIRPKIRQ